MSLTPAIIVVSADVGALALTTTTARYHFPSPKSRIFDRTFLAVCTTIALGVLTAYLGGSTKTPWLQVLGGGTIVGSTIFLIDLVVVEVIRWPLAIWATSVVVVGGGATLVHLATKDLAWCQTQENLDALFPCFGDDVAVLLGWLAIGFGGALALIKVTRMTCDAMLRRAR